MAELGVRLCIHGEDVDVTTDVFSREEKFIEKSLAPLMKQIPELQVVFEHVSTSEAVDFVTQNKNMAATVTPQHLIFNRNHLLAGRLYPHRYCAPLLKKESDRKALVKAVTQDFNEKFFLGTDSAPHLRNEKESSCGCAGCFSSPHALAKYIEIFELEGKLGNLEKFSSINGAKFYNLSLNSRKISLKREKWLAEEKFFTNKSQQIVSFVQDEVLTWKINY
jgi:dihydroorotase